MLSPGRLVAYAATRFGEAGALLRILLST